MYLLLIGPPGCGKGTQAELLADRLGLPRISGGDLLRAEAKSRGPRAALIRHRLDAGESPIRS
jgi:adenylate kinase